MWFNVAPGLLNNYYIYAPLACNGISSYAFLVIHLYLFSALSFPIYSLNRELILEVWLSIWGVLKSLPLNCVLYCSSNLITKKILLERERAPEPPPPTPLLSDRFLSHRFGSLASLSLNAHLIVKKPTKIGKLTNS